MHSAPAAVACRNSDSLQLKTAIVPLAMLFNPLKTPLVGNNNDVENAKTFSYSFSPGKSCVVAACAK